MFWVSKNPFGSQALYACFSPFSEKVICRCNQPRRDGGPFHCPFCGTAITWKDAITTDLMERKKTAQLRSMPLSQAASPETHPAVPTDRGTLLLPPSESAVKLTTLTFKRRP